MNIYSLLNLGGKLKMPARDGTGPMGAGPGTGWGRGPCVHKKFLRRNRRFWRMSNPETVELSKEEQKKILSGELKDLQEEKEAVEEKLKELE